MTRGPYIRRVALPAGSSYLYWDSPISDHSDPAELMARPQLRDDIAAYTSPEHHGLRTGDVVVIDARSPRDEPPADEPVTPGIEAVITALSAERFTLATRPEPPKPRIAGRIPAHRPAPPVPPWARRRGRR